MDMATAKRRLSTSSIVFWHGMDYRIIGFTRAKHVAYLMPVGGYWPVEASLEEITE